LPAARFDVDTSPAFEQTVTGIPLWLIQDYLEQLGARQDLDGWLQGEDWRARLTQVEDYEIGSVRVGQVHLEVHGEAHAVEALLPALRRKLLRAGG
jgi:hypothetical protein